LDRSAERVVAAQVRRRSKGRLRFLVERVRRVALSLPSRDCRAHRQVHSKALSRVGRGSVDRRGPARRAMFSRKMIVGVIRTRTRKKKKKRMSLRARRAKSHRTNQSAATQDEKRGTEASDRG
jgi:hypothetical protein